MAESFSLQGRKGLISAFLLNSRQRTHNSCYSFAFVEVFQDHLYQYPYRHRSLRPLHRRESLGCFGSEWTRVGWMLVYPLKRILDDSTSTTSASLR
jgi:hypothetical protein